MCGWHEQQITAASVMMMMVGMSIASIVLLRALNINAITEGFRKKEVKRQSTTMEKFSFIQDREFDFEEMRRKD